MIPSIGDIITYTGATDDQVNWGGNDDPRGVLKEEQSYTVEDVDEHTWHTKVKLKGIDGWFNSVSFTSNWVEIEPDRGELMTLDAWKDTCDGGGFVDYDGMGDLVKEGRRILGFPWIYPSQKDIVYSLAKMCGFTHVLWYNR